MTRLILWIIAHVILIFCIIGLLKRSRFKEAPFFLSYVVYEEVLFAALLPIAYWKAGAVIYQWVVIVGGVGIDSCLQLAVFYGIVKTLILPNSPHMAILKPLLRTVLAVTILLAAGISGSLANAGLRPLVRIFEVLNFSTNLLNLGLLLVLFFFTRTFHISWKSLPMGVALGFGITSSAEIGATSLVSGWGMNALALSDALRLSAFIACSVVWLVYIYLPNRRVIGQAVQQAEIELHEKALAGIVSDNSLALVPKWE